ncbi:MAG: hypothetical protein LBI05_11600 [Planctomycetaceae bacterium]|jgi:hypothetical protein|nr:hypothetical protein [Planctomycetaceae bacterium]
MAIVHRLMESLNGLPPIPDSTVGRDTVKTRIYYEIHTQRRHIRTTDDKIDVREALDKNLMVIEVRIITKTAVFAIERLRCLIRSLTTAAL